jgi:hypothetical protein
VGRALEYSFQKYEAVALVFRSVKSSPGEEEEEILNQVQSVRNCNRETGWLH